MIVECTQCGRKGTLEGRPYSGKKVRLKCPYCSEAFLYSVPQNGNGSLMAASEVPVVQVAPPPPVAPALSPPQPAPTVVKAETTEAPDALVNEAKRIARLVISEIKLYNQDKIAKAVTRREVLDLLKNDLIKGKQHYNTRIASKLPPGPDYFMETVKEILLAGKN